MNLMRSGFIVYGIWSSPDGGAIVVGRGRSRSRISTQVPLTFEQRRRFAAAGFLDREKPVLATTRSHVLLPSGMPLLRPSS